MKSQSLPSSTSVGFLMPFGFNETAHDAVVHQVSTHASNCPAAFGSFASAWNGIAYRVRAASDYHNEFHRLVTISNKPPFEGKFHQDRAIFGF
ncbi:MAG: hypothetical protein ABIR48_04860, partial [Gammaproteobacteria bacterium]